MTLDIKMDSVKTSRVAYETVFMFITKQEPITHESGSCVERIRSALP